MITNQHQWKRHPPCARSSSASWPPPRSSAPSPSPPRPTPPPPTPTASSPWPRPRSWPSSRAGTRSSVGSRTSPLRRRPVAHRLQRVHRHHARTGVDCSDGTIQTLPQHHHHQPDRESHLDRSTTRPDKVTGWNPRRQGRERHHREQHLRHLVVGPLPELRHHLRGDHGSVTNPFATPRAEPHRRDDVRLQQHARQHRGQPVRGPRSPGCLTRTSSTAPQTSGSGGASRCRHPTYPAGIPAAPAPTGFGALVGSGPRRQKDLAAEQWVRTTLSDHGTVSQSARRQDDAPQLSRRVDPVAPMRGQALLI